MAPGEVGESWWRWHNKGIEELQRTDYDVTMSVPLILQGQQVGKIPVVELLP